jgi:hypothetical protein
MIWFLAWFERDDEKNTIDAVFDVVFGDGAKYGGEGEGPMCSMRIDNPYDMLKRSLGLVVSLIGGAGTPQKVRDAVRLWRNLQFSFTVYEKSRPLRRLVGKEWVDKDPGLCRSNIEGLLKARYQTLQEAKEAKEAKKAKEEKKAREALKARGEEREREKARLELFYLRNFPELGRKRAKTAAAKAAKEAKREAKKAWLIDKALAKRDFSLAEGFKLLMEGADGLRLVDLHVRGAKKRGAAPLNGLDMGLSNRLDSPPPHRVE